MNFAHNEDYISSMPSRAICSSAATPPSTIQLKLHLRRSQVIVCSSGVGLMSISMFIGSFIYKLPYNDLARPNNIIVIAFCEPNWKSTVL